MSEIDRIVSGTIKADTVSSPREGFGVQIGMAYHTLNTDPFRDYESTADMLTDGYSLAHPHVRMAAAAFAQTPKPKIFRAGRMTTAVQHTVKLTVKTFVAGKIIGVTIYDAAGVAHVITRTVPGSSSLAAEATAVATLIAAIPGVQSATAVSADITVTITTPGNVWYYESLSNLDYLDSTPDAAIDTDLSNILTIDDGFFYVTIALGSKANIDKVDAWAETQAPKRFFAAQTADSREKQSGNSILGTAIKAASLTHTLPMYHSKPRQYMACAWAGLMSTKDPGSATFALKQLALVDTDILTATEKTALDAAGLNYYVAAGSRGVTRKDGAVGSGEKADIIVGTDWLSNEINTTVFDFLASQDKVDFDDAGIANIEGQIYAVLEKGVVRRFLEPGTLVVVPLLADDVNPTDRAARVLSGVQWSAKLRGAIHAVNYAGNLTV